MSSAITTPPAKLTLPGTSKMSLHDRFTKLAKAKPVSTAAAPTVSSAVKGVPAVAGARASAKNRKLALQMASRPSVQAALKIKNKSIKQRLGTLKPATARPANKPVNSAATNVKSRLSPQKGNAVGIDPARLSLPANLGAGRFLNGAERRGPRGAAPNQRRSLNTSLNTSANSGGIKRVGAGGGMGIKGGRRSLKSRLSNTNALNTNVKRFTRPGNPGGRRGGRAVNPNRPQQPGKKPAPNGGQQAAQPPKSRENLDMDLDQYMAKSKSHLDHDLDAYMAQSGAN